MPRKLPRASNSRFPSSDHAYSTMSSEVKFVSFRGVPPLKGMLQMLELPSLSSM